jgi:uncharacterized protein
MTQKSKIPYSIVSSDFLSCGTRCGADLYLPETGKKPSIVVMAHGFGAEKAFGLPAYAGHFASNGLAILLFDYRCFGESDGEPRNYVDPFRHLKDWEAAVSHARSLPDINSDKLALWGSSFSGGHVIVTASKDPKISAIVAQVPFVDSVSTTRMLGVKFLMQAMPHAIKDLARIAAFRAPHFVKIIGTPDEFAVMNTPESYPGFLSLVPKGSTWENQCPARILLTFSLYRPIASAHKIKCPALIMLAEKDSLIDATAVEKTADKIPKGELVKYPFGHFDIYTGEAFNDAVQKQAKFLKTHLGL